MTNSHVSYLANHAPDRGQRLTCSCFRPSQSACAHQDHMFRISQTMHQTPARALPAAESGTHTLSCAHRAQMSPAHVGLTCIVSSKPCILGKPCRRKQQEPPQRYQTFGARTFMLADKVWVCGCVRTPDPPFLAGQRLHTHRATLTDAWNVYGQM